MNTLSDYKNTYEDASAKVSDITRQMALAGIAIVWIFKQPDNSTKLLTPDLILSLFLFGITLTFDLLQYIYKTIIWYWFFRKHELTTDSKHPNPLLKASPKMNYPTWEMFWIKVSSLILGYVFIFIFLTHKLFM